MVWCFCQVHRDEENGKILNLVFVWADDGEKLKVDVPVVFKGLDHCPGLQKGNCFFFCSHHLPFLQLVSQVMLTEKSCRTDRSSILCIGLDTDENFADRFCLCFCMASAHVLLFYCYPAIILIELSFVKRNLSLVSDSKVCIPMVKGTKKPDI